MSLPKEYNIDPTIEEKFSIKLSYGKGHGEVVDYLMSLPKEYNVHL